MVPIRKFNNFIICMKAKGIMVKYSNRTQRGRYKKVGVNDTGRES